MRRLYKFILFVVLVAFIVAVTVPLVLQNQAQTQICPENTYNMSGTCTPCPGNYPYSFAGSTDIGSCFRSNQE